VHKLSAHVKTWKHYLKDLKKCVPIVTPYVTHREGSQQLEKVQNDQRAQCRSIQGKERHSAKRTSFLQKNISQMIRHVLSI